MSSSPINPDIPLKPEQVAEYLSLAIDAIRTDCQGIDACLETAASHLDNIISQQSAKVQTVARKLLERARYAIRKDSATIQPVLDVLTVAAESTVTEESARLSSIDAESVTAMGPIPSPDAKPLGPGEVRTLWGPLPSDAEGHGVLAGWYLLADGSLIHVDPVVAGGVNPTAMELGLPPDTQTWTYYGIDAVREMTRRATDAASGASPLPADAADTMVARAYCTRPGVQPGYDDVTGESIPECWPAVASPPVVVDGTEYLETSVLGVPITLVDEPETTPAVDTPPALAIAPSPGERRVESPPLEQPAQCCPYPVDWNQPGALFSRLTPAAYLESAIESIGLPAGTILRGPDDLVRMREAYEARPRRPEELEPVKTYRPARGQ